VLNFAHPNSKPTDWNSPEQLAVREAGLGEFPSPPLEDNEREQLPAGGGRFSVPPHLYTTGLVNQSFRSFYYLFDQALKKSREQAVACRFDPVIEQAIKEAKTPIAQLSWYIEPTDETNPAEVDAAQKVTLAISRTPRLQQFFMDLLEGLWFGRAALQLTYQWDSDDPSLMTVKNWMPLPSDSLVFRWAGDLGVQVNSAFEGEADTWNLGRVHYFTPKEMEAVLLHQDERRPADWYDITGAGSINGVGWRNVVFWYWFIKTNILANLLDLTERIGNGVWLAGFDQSNPEGRNSWERAIAEYRDKRVLMRPIDKMGNSLYDLNILEPGATTTANLEGLIRYFEGIIRSVILGHPLGAGAEINIGGDPAAIYGDAISRSTKYHAGNLAETLTYRWLPVLYKYMCPGVRAGTFKFSTDHPNADQMLSFAERLGALGFSVDLDDIADICGLKKAAPNAQIYSKVQNLNPIGLEATPQQVPIAGNTPQPVQSLGIQNQAAGQPAVVSTTPQQ
jgi:hypothetical protein